MGDDGASDTPQDQGESTSSSSTAVPPPAHLKKLTELIIARKIDFAMWMTRLLTIVFAFGFIIPLFGNSASFYYKALLAGAATSALRLHQRIGGNVSFSRAFLSQLLLEDSCHYLFYSLIFIYCSPVTLALIPVVLFAILHFASFTLTMLDALGRNSAWIARFFISLIEFQSGTILRMTAGAEIFTMFFAIIYPFMGRASLVTPFLYYRFLTLRYASRRNHYTRQMFYELRMVSERFVNDRRCPGIISNVVNKAISFIGRLAPPVPTSS